MKHIALILFTVLTIQLYSQHRVKGNIMDNNNEAAIGASVSELGRENGTFSDYDGSYSIEVTDTNSILVFDYFGCQKVKLKANDSIINVKLHCSFKYCIDTIYSADSTKNDEFGNYLIKSDYKWHINQLSGLKEKPLNEEDSASKRYLFRILYLPSFEHPISFTISQNQKCYFLEWKVGKGSGGYSPRGVEEKGRIKISEKEYFIFCRYAKTDSFHSLPLITYLPMCDGTSWVFENNIGNPYKVFYSNYPDFYFLEAFAYLLHLSNYNISNYPINFESVYFDKSDNIIDIDSIHEQIVLKLNTPDSIIYKSNYIDNSDFKIKINKKGKIKSVKYLQDKHYRHRYEKYEVLLWNIVDRKYLKAIKKQLKHLKFDSLNIDKKVIIPLSISYNEKSNQVELE